MKTKHKPWGKVKSHRRKKVRRLVLTKLILISVLLVGGLLYIQDWYFNGVIKDVSAQSYLVNVNKSELIVDNRAIEEHVWDIMTNEYGLSLQEKAKAISIIQCESRWNKMAINKNSDGSYDLGLWQINEKYHKIGRECSFDVYCSTRYAMELYKQQGWTPWVCSRL